MSLNDFRIGFQKLLGTKLGYAIVAVFAILLVFSFVYSGFGNNGPLSGSGAGAAAQGETVATVNGDAITRGDFEQTADGLRQQAQMFGNQIGPLQSGQLNAAAMDKLITAKLQLQVANKIGLKASDDEIAKSRQQIVNENGVAKELGLPPNASVADIDKVLAQNNQPSIEDKLPDDAVRQQLLLQKLETFEGSKVNVSEQDARDSYTQYHTRHILIGNKTRSDVQAQSQAQQVLAKAQAPGADFAALAKQYSEDNGTKSNGGDDGWLGEDNQFNRHASEFVQATKALKPGGITLIKSPDFGYFIIKLEATRSNAPKDFDKNTAKYIDQIKDSKKSQAMQDFDSALQNDPKNKIVITDPELRADRTMTVAAKESDPAKQQTGYRSAIADYQKALASKPTGSVAGDINVQIGEAYQALHQDPQAITAFETALQTTDDPNLRVVLGNLYLQNKQNDKAAAQFQVASKNAWDDQTLHQQLMVSYLQMKRPDLVAQEQAWIKQYQDRQKQAASPMGGLGNSIPMPSTPGSHPAATAPTPAKPSAPQAITVLPGKTTVVPASGTPATPIKKPGE
jgi:parvulin-like peptidyl-prolyl isomerase